MASLRIHASMHGVNGILGPGKRSVVWVQGCSLHCPGCMVPETWDCEGGRSIYVADLAKEIISNDDVEGITVSGGEPFQQASAVSRLLEMVKNSGRNTWVYTGYTIAELLAKKDQTFERLLSFTDVLVDGRYDQEAAGAHLFRGSANQRIVSLTDAIPDDGWENENYSRIKVSLNVDGDLLIVGIPPPGFLKKFKDISAKHGISVYFGDM